MPRPSMKDASKYTTSLLRMAQMNHYEKLGLDQLPAKRLTPSVFYAIALV